MCEGGMMKIHSPQSSASSQKKLQAVCALRGDKFISAHALCPGNGI
jgi:hypothetical protein